MRIVNGRDGEVGFYVGRPSDLGNPFIIGRDGDRGECIQKYRRWLYERIMEEDARVLSALARLDDDATLVCWCAPDDCHAEVIERAWQWAVSQGRLDAYIAA